MNEPTIWNETNILSAMDCLATGDLDESSRETMLVYIENHPDHWKQLAVKFLEAQLWQESYRAAASKTTSTEPVSRLQLGLPTESLSSTRPLKNRFRRLQELAALSAIVLIAFGAGWFTSAASPVVSVTGTTSPDFERAVEDRKSEVGEEQWVWATLESPSVNLPFPGARVQVPLKLQDGNLLASAFSPVELSRYESQLYERRGLAVTTEKQFFSAKLPNGTNITLPVSHLVAKPIALQVD